MGLIAFLGATLAGIAYWLRGGRPVARLSALAFLPTAPRRLPGTRFGRVATRRPVGNRGWLLLYMLGLGAELAHGLALTIGSLVVYSDPGLAGLDSFIPLWALLIYVAGNLGLVAFGVVPFVLMLSRRRSAIATNVLFNALSVAFLLTWFVLGAKSPVGTVVDSLPGLVAIAYFSRSRRVRNTYTAT